MSAKAIFVGGTASHVGKSWMATAICRHLFKRGLRVAPFKAQNMSLNSYPCRDGGEIGRAQVVQAEACGLEPVAAMNPILLKPNSPLGSQVVVDGKVWRNLSAREYYEHFDWLLGRVLAAYERLACRVDYIVVEGAGSVAELNLRERDLVNFGLAARLQAPALLVADIDRGGVFASLLGTLWLLTPEERQLVRSFAVNRFRGDPSLFASGVDILTARSGTPCLGVFPWVAGASIDAEDSVSLDDGVDRDGEGVGVAIVRLPRVSNFTDFRLLPAARWIDRPVSGRFDCVILPGSKNTISDLEWLRAQGLDAWLMDQHRAGATIAGICGGYQMLGEWIEDPFAMESDAGGARGLALLPVRTVLAREKATRVVNASTVSGLVFRAYEIHLGVTEVPPGATPFAVVEGRPEGMRLGRVVGTYLHGALEDHRVLGELLGRPIAPPPPKEAAYDRLAAWFEQHADLALFEDQYL